MNDLKRVFVSTPMSEEYKPVRQVIIAAIREAEAIPLTFESIAEEKGVTKVLPLLGSANMVVADLSDHRPNVIYEVGYAHGNHVPVILLFRLDRLNVPYYFSGIPSILYQLDELGKLKINLRQMLNLFLYETQEEAMPAYELV